MFGGNQTEQRERRDRIWGAVAFLAFAAGFLWLTMTDPRTEDLHRMLFWISAPFGMAIAAYLVWIHADKDSPPEVKGGLGGAGVGLLLSNLLEDVRWVVSPLFGFSAGFCLGAAGALLALVFVRPFLQRSASTD